MKRYIYTIMLLITIVIVLLSCVLIDMQKEKEELHIQECEMIKELYVYYTLNDYNIKERMILKREFEAMKCEEGTKE